MTNKDTSVKAAVVTGAHSFDVVNFHGLFRGLDGVDAYIQHMDDWAASAEDVRRGYDVTCFYNFQMETPPAEGLPWYCGDPRRAVEGLAGSESGILLLHHAVLAYPDWPLWSDIVGIERREFDYHIDQKVKIDVADEAHPITEGLRAWEMTDETYTMDEPRADSRVLLTLDHPKSMKSIAWTRRHGKARVFCLQSGHDGKAWSNADFRLVLQRGIMWCAGRV